MRVTGANLLARFAEGIEPAGVFGWILLLQFFAHALGESGAFSVGGDGDLQIAALHDGAVVKMAVRDVVHGVAEDATGLRFLKDGGVDG